MSQNLLSAAVVIGTLRAITLIAQVTWKDLVNAKLVVQDDIQSSSGPLRKEVDKFLGFCCCTGSTCVSRSVV